MSTFGSLTANRAYVKSGNIGMEMLGKLGKMTFADRGVSTPIAPSQVQPETIPTENLATEEGKHEYLS